MTKRHMHRETSDRDTARETSRILCETVGALLRTDPDREAEARAHLDALTKPRGSLGRLEDLAARIACIQNSMKPCMHPARVVTAAADHGVVAEGVSAYPQSVTRQMVENFLSGGAAVSVMCRSLELDHRVVDIGVAGEPFAEHARLDRRRILPGTANMAVGPSMNIADCVRALETGIDLADRAASEGMRGIGLGEMGIGNTTAACALYCALFGLAPQGMVGPGAGLDPTGVARKTTVVARALQANRESVASGDPVRILAAVGGLEIACLAGLALGAARNGLAVVVDGYISTAAFAVASRISPHCAEYAFLSHVSAEPGHPEACRQLGMRPLFDLGMRLGEGTGSALGLNLLRVACELFSKMATFASAGVETEMPPQAGAS